MSHPSHSLPLHLWGNTWPRVSDALGRCVSLKCLLVGFTAAVSSTMTPHILSVIAVTQFSHRGVRGSSMPKVRGAHWHACTIIWDAFIQRVLVITLIITLRSSFFFYHTTAHSFRRCWWIRHLELADKGRKWGRTVQRRKEEQNLEEGERFSEAAYRK